MSSAKSVNFDFLGVGGWVEGQRKSLQNPATNSLMSECNKTIKINNSKTAVLKKQQ